MIDTRSGPATRILAIESVVFFALIAFAYWPTFAWMVYRWDEHESYSSHGWLIPFISGALMFARRAEWLAGKANPVLGLVVGALAVGAHLIAGLADVSSISGYTLLPLVAAFVLLTGGISALRALWFPILFLFFMIPLPDFLVSGMNFRLKLMASDLAASMLNGVGLATIRDGSFLVFENSRLAVGDVCSGLRSLISLVALGVLYAYAVREKGRLNGIFVLLAVFPAALIANGIRIMVVSLLFTMFGSKFVFTPFIGSVDVHLLTGGIIFVGAFVILFGADRFADLFSKKTEIKKKQGNP